MPKVIVVAGPSGSGKTRLCERLGLPTVNLDDFYKDGTDPTLPLSELGFVDWDDPRSWHHDEAVAAIDELCRTGSVDLPVYEMSKDTRVGTRRLDLNGADCFVAEGIFAAEIVSACRANGCLAAAVCVRNHPLMTFWRRLTRDIQESRKPLRVALQRGWWLLRDERRIVAHMIEAGCEPMTGQEAYRRLS